MCASAIANTPPVAPDTPPPDEAFIEFLGKDDVGDSNLMEYWNQVEQSAEQTAAPPSPKDAKK